MEPWFRNWFNSPYYHLLYFNRDEQEAALFIDKLIDHLAPKPHSRMLDVACGKGRHSVQLAEKGFDVTGIDLSLESINEALNFEKENLHFYVHDMRQPFRINYYDYAFNFFTSFGYFQSPRENDSAIRTISNSMKKDGIFVMDYLNVHYAEDHTVHHSEKSVDGVNFVLKKWYDEQFFYKKIEVEDDALEEPLIFTEKVAKFSLGDFNDMFSFQGLQIKEVFGSYQFEPYHIKNSPRLIMVAQKVK